MELRARVFRALFFFLSDSRVLSDAPFLSICDFYHDEGIDKHIISIVK